MAVDLDSIRRELAVLARNKKLRSTEWNRMAPSEWRPTQVRNPHAEGFYFTDIGAWHYIATLLEGGHPLEEILLSQPPNGRGYVMHVELETGGPTLYIKVERRSGRIIGRSFHYSYR